MVREPARRPGQALLRRGKLDEEGSSSAGGGGRRPYDRKAGYARRILPQGRWGDVELIGRYGRVDTTDEGIDGGVMDGWWAGVNWWATNRFKASVTYGNIDLDRLDLVGNTQTFLARLQWIY